MTMEPLVWHTEPSPIVTSRLVAVLTCLAVAIGFTVSVFALESNGYPYTSPGGNPLVKIHPSTYLTLLAFMSAAIAYGNPLGFVATCASRFPGAMYFLIILAVMISWTLLIQRQPLTSQIDTFLPATLLVFLISNLSGRQHLALVLFIHIAMNINAAIGIVEVATGWRLTPISLNGEVILWDWRASALLGHPLQNAMMTGAYLLMIVFGADRRIPAPLRVAIAGLQAVALVAFGGRTAMVLSFGLVGLRILWILTGVIRGKRFDPRLAALILMAIPVLVGIILLAYSLGSFDRMIERFTNDEGSADTRVSILRIFNSFPLSDLLMGPDPEVLVAKTYIEGTIAGIESFVFGFFLQSGLIISIIFFCGLAAFSYELWRIGSRIGIVYIVYFYTVAAGAASLSVKGQTLLQFTVLFLTVEAMPSLSDRPAARPTTRPEI